MTRNLSEQETIRRQKKSELEGLGINPYPAASFISSTSTRDILENFDKNPEAYKKVSLAGRLMNRRIMGSASFAVLKDDKDKIQLYVHRDSISPDEDKTFYNTVFKKLMDIGDIIGVEGYVFKTKVGEISIHVEKLTLLTKSLKPLPIVKETDDNVYDAFTDPENRYRQRYVDLIVNPHVKEVFNKRAKIIQIIRNHYDELGCTEVETPTLQPIYGGALANPFTTHHNALDSDFFLKISPELYLKRLIVGGFDGVYEICKQFRNEGMSRFHNPEFTGMEAYVAYKDYNWMMDQTEELLEKIAITITGGTEVTVEDKSISFKRPFQRYTMFEAINKFTGVDISKMDEVQLRNTCKDLEIEL